MDKQSKLNNKQQSFVQAYLVSSNATEAAKQAGYSVKTAYSQGHDLLKKPEIKAAIAKAQEKVAKATQVTAEYITKQTQEILNYSNQKDEYGNMRNPKDALKALDQLSRLTGSYQDKLAVDMSVKKIEVVRVKTITDSK